MAGNVWEWVEGGSDVVRGGAFNRNASAVVCGARLGNVNVLSRVGLRVVTVLPEHGDIGYMPVPAGGGVAAFRIGRTEVTNAQYAQCVSAGACSEPSVTTEYDDAAYANHPVVYVTRAQARTYAAWIGGALPTEAQWLRACQGDDRRTYPWGDQPPDEARANFDGAADRTAPVGSYPAGASPYGALDMAGNVWEWVDDGNVVVRGGAFGNDANYIACTTRYAAAESVVNDNVGFRIVSSTP